MTAWSYNNLNNVNRTLIIPTLLLTFLLKGTDAFKAVPQSDSQLIIRSKSKPIFRYSQHNRIQLHNLNRNIWDKVSQKLRQASSTKPHQQHRHSVIYRKNKRKREKHTLSLEMFDVRRMYLFYWMCPEITLVVWSVQPEKGKACHHDFMMRAAEETAVHRHRGGGCWGRSCWLGPFFVLFLLTSSCRDVNIYKEIGLYRPVFTGK